MVRPNHRRETAALTTELLVAIALLTSALFPLAYSFASEKRLARTYYQRAIAVEIVDGEMERLLAGAWHSYKPGTQEYPVRALSGTNLPPGKFELSIEKENIRLQWLPSVKMHGGPVVREAKVR